MKKTLSTIILLLAACLVLGAQKKDIVFQKNYPFLYAVEHSPAVKTALLTDPALKELASQKTAALMAASSDEDAIRACLFTDDEVSLSSGRIAALAGEKAFQELSSSLRKDGRYIIYNYLPDPDFLKAAWELDVNGLNYAIEVYALGKKPYYAAIDAIDFNLDGGQYIRRVRDDVLSNIIAFTEGEPFYAIPLQSALTWLDANGRDESADFEPMGKGINKVAYRAVRTTRWKKYPYSLILVLGAGPENARDAISPQSRMRASYAAMLYRKGLAPFIVVSGGRVHPFKTPYTEALEIKKYLMENFGIPEKAIIAEPHARHTTTNIRNTVRIMMEEGIPMDKPALVTSSAFHIDWVCNPEFLRFGKEQMLIEPFRLGERLDKRTAVFFPLPEASEVASGDPLDP